MKQQDLVDMILEANKDAQDQLRQMFAEILPKEIGNGFNRRTSQRQPLLPADDQQAEWGPTDNDSGFGP